MTDLESYIRTIDDFPKQGVGFKDISTLTRNPIGFKNAIDEMAKHLSAVKVDIVLGIEQRGFIFGGAVADRIGVGFDLIRKPGKLPGETTSENYDLEYGTDTLEIHQDSIAKGSNAVIIDDLLATGGTMSAALKLVKKLGGNVTAVLFLIELGFLNGREKLPDENIISLINYDN